MNFEEFKNICFRIKNDISYHDFISLCESHNYTDEYIENIWEFFCSKPIDFLIYHDVGKEIYSYVYLTNQIIK